MHWVSEKLVKLTACMLAGYPDIDDLPRATVEDLESIRYRADRSFENCVFL